MKFALFVFYWFFRFLVMKRFSTEYFSVNMNVPFFMSFQVPFSTGFGHMLQKRAIGKNIERDQKRFRKKLKLLSLCFLATYCIFWRVRMTSKYLRGNSFSTFFSLKMIGKLPFVNFYNWGKMKVSIGSRLFRILLDSKV